MIEVEFLGPLGNKSYKSEAKSLKELKEELQNIIELKEWLSECAIALNDKIICSLDVELKNGDKVVLLPPVCGG
ncbi:MAG: MoaD/ThiS family protein [Helicobacter sp.]|nr:MoaD/ThiS family protein [Helicobacteraceae bacterium]MDY3113297.1 MoaD/ThiS family protein [Helicobacter sp.]